MAVGARAAPAPGRHLALLATGLGLGISVTTLFALTPAALLIAMVPISVGGFGAARAHVRLFPGHRRNSRRSRHCRCRLPSASCACLVGGVGGMTWSLMSDHHYRVDAPSA